MPDAPDIAAGMTEQARGREVEQPPAPPPQRPVGAIGRAQDLLHLARLLLQSDPSGTGGEAPSRTSGRSDVYDISTWPLPRPPRHRILVIQLLEALVPIALGGAGSGADLQQSKLGRELIARLVQYCEEPLGVRGDLLQIIERHIRPEHIEIGAGGVPARVAVLEPTGSETQVFAKLGSDSIDAIVKDRLKVSPGDEVPLRIDPGRVHLFDAASGARI